MSAGKAVKIGAQTGAQPSVHDAKFTWPAEVRSQRMSSRQCWSWSQPVCDLRVVAVPYNLEHALKCAWVELGWGTVSFIFDIVLTLEAFFILFVANKKHSLKCMNSAWLRACLRRLWPCLTWPVWRWLYPRFGKFTGAPVDWIAWAKLFNFCFSERLISTSSHWTSFGRGYFPYCVQSWSNLSIYCMIVKYNVIG